jgi:hypothetical protein
MCDEHVGARFCQGGDEAMRKVIVVDTDTEIRKQELPYATAACPLVVGPERGVACVLAGKDRTMVFDVEPQQPEEEDEDEAEPALALARTADPAGEILRQLITTNYMRDIQMDGNASERIADSGDEAAGSDDMHDTDVEG